VERRHTTLGRRGFTHAIAAAARTLAADLRLDLIVALTTTGRTARILSQLRPPALVLACTEDEGLARRLALYWGVRPFVTRFRPHTEAMIKVLDRELIRRGLARPGAAVVVVGSVPIIAQGQTNFVQLHRLGGAGAAG
jgi:pyruvate kinase